MLEKRKGIPAKKGYYTAKSGVICHYDSMTELAMMMYFDSLKVSWIKNTKLRIPYVFEGKNRKYIPDFIVDGRKVVPDIIIEIKGSNDKPELPFKVEAAEKYCKENGMEYLLMSYDKVRSLFDWTKVQEYHNTNIN